MPSCSMDCSFESKQGRMSVSLYNETALTALSFTYNRAGIKYAVMSDDVAIYKTSSASMDPSIKVFLK